MEKKNIKPLGREAKILIVDDDGGVRDFLTRFLKRKDYEHIFSVATGEEGLEVITKEKDIQLVLLDVRLPDMNGIEVLRKITDISKDTDVIMITGSSSFRRRHSLTTLCAIFATVIAPRGGNDGRIQKSDAGVCLKTPLR